MQIFKSFTPDVTKLINRGAVGIMPSDTLYGIFGRLFDEAAITRMYELKGRDLTKPVGTILINDPTQIEHIADPKTLLMAQIYWPGPNSVVIPVTDSMQYAHKGYGSLAVRIPDSKPLQSLLKVTGPLATSSANFANQPPATTLEEALEMFGESVDFYVDGGDLSHRKPSRIIRFNGKGEIETLRGETK